jgi:hypothetical protein
MDIRDGGGTTNQCAMKVHAGLGGFNPRSTRDGTIG